MRTLFSFWSQGVFQMGMDDPFSNATPIFEMIICYTKHIRDDQMPRQT